MTEPKADSPFTTAALRRQVEAAMATVNPGHGHAQIEVTLPDGTVRGLVAARVNDHWLVQGEASFTIPTHDWGVSVKVLASW